MLLPIPLNHALFVGECCFTEQDENHFFHDHPSSDAMPRVILRGWSSHRAIARPAS
jgi:hypothetical protein